jgi:hypothetical protein
VLTLRLVDAAAAVQKVRVTHEENKPGKVTATTLRLQ